jgi:hypothetical protein
LLTGAEKLGGFLYVARRDPEHRAIAAIANGNGIHRDHVDAGIGEFFADLRNGPGPVIAFDQENGLARTDFQLELTRRCFELRSVGWNEIDLRAAPAGETSECKEFTPASRSAPSSLAPSPTLCAVSKLK